MIFLKLKLLGYLSELERFNFSVWSSKKSVIVMTQNDFLEVYVDENKDGYYLGFSTSSEFIPIKVRHDGSDSKVYNVVDNVRSSCVDDMELRVNHDNEFKVETYNIDYECELSSMEDCSDLDYTRIFVDYQINHIKFTGSTITVIMKDFKFTRILASGFDIDFTKG